MSKRGIWLFSLGVVLLVIYGAFFMNWFAKPDIQIIANRRPGRVANARDNSVPQVDQVSFAFNGKYRFNTIQVVREDDWKTNKYPYALWSLISDRHSAPINAFTYGDRIKGMKPAIPGARPDPLEPNVRYMLLVEAESGKVKGQTNFFTVVASRPTVRR